MEKNKSDYQLTTNFKLLGQIPGNLVNEIFFLSLDFLLGE